MFEHTPPILRGRGFGALSTGLSTALSTVSVDKRDG